MKKISLLLLAFIATLGLGACVSDTEVTRSDIYPEFMTFDETQNYDKGDVFTPLSGLLVFDAVDGDITSTVEVKGTGGLGLDEENRVTNTGTFNLRYLATNSSGNTTQKNFTVTVSFVYAGGDLNYELVWFDEFEYEGLPDANKWLFEEGGHGWGNGESQYYTDGDTDNAYVSNGVLTITAIKESYAGNEYTSARINSTNEGNWTYGRFEIKAKLPAGRGLWPAIWMLPTNWEYGDWPASGEIDIMEYVGYDENQIYYTIHTEAYNHTLHTQIGGHDTYEDVSNMFHVYELEWLPDVLIWYIDGVEVFRYSVPTNAPLNSTTWPFDIEFHLMLNIAVGGSWGGLQGIDDSVFPQSMEIDYVRVYQATNLE